MLPMLNRDQARPDLRARRSRGPRSRGGGRRPVRGGADGRTGAGSSAGAEPVNRSRFARRGGAGSGSAPARRSSVRSTPSSPEPGTVPTYAFQTIELEMMRALASPRARGRADAARLPPARGAAGGDRSAPPPRPPPGQPDLAKGEAAPARRSGLPRPRARAAGPLAAAKQPSPHRLEPVLRRRLVGVAGGVGRADLEAVLAGLQSLQLPAASRA